MDSERRALIILRQDNLSDIIRNFAAFSLKNRCYPFWTWADMTLSGTLLAVAGTGSQNKCIGRSSLGENGETYAGRKRLSIQTKSNVPCDVIPKNSA